MPLSNHYVRRQEIFIAAVNAYHGSPPVFKMDTARERITLIEASSCFIRELMENSALLFLRPEGLIVEFLTDENS